MADKNLIDGIQSEMNRCRELLNIYKEIPSGFFGAAMIQQAISDAEKSISSGDVVEMVKCYRRLKACE